MNAIHIRRKVDSDTLQLPELKQMIGKTVEIIVVEALPHIIAGTGDWDAAEKAAARIKDFDYDALTAQDACDIQHAEDHSR